MPSGDCGRGSGLVGSPEPTNCGSCTFSSRGRDDFVRPPFRRESMGPRVMRRELLALLQCPSCGSRLTSRVGARHETWPLFVYAKYPFNVLYNDQFDRFSAPIEKRYDR